MHEAKTHLSRLVAEALDGEDVVIAKAGKQLVKLVPCERPQRKLGLLEGQIWIADDFDDDDELIALFEGKESNDF